jgi:adenylate kinase
MDGKGLEFRPGPVLLLGAPGVGKGTQAKVLMAEFGIPQISTGDILRDQRARKTELGLMADELVSTGQLVPDDLVNRLVEARLGQADCSNGYILDGFPRTLVQAEWLDQFLAQTDPSLPLIALSIVVKHEELLKRITGRLISPAGRIYNIYTNPPLIPGVCDVDGTTLIQRSDDSVEVFEDRMKVFYQDTAAVIEHYRQQGRFAEIDGAPAVEQVTGSVLTALHELRVQ